MSTYLAHSGKAGVPPQPYEQHVENVSKRALAAAREVGRYADTGYALESVTRAAAEYHDLGKLLAENQQALAAEERAAHLPLNHVDAGTALLLQKDAAYAAATVYAHHRGLPDFQAEKVREENAFRDHDVVLRARTDGALPSLTALHHKLLASAPLKIDEPDIPEYNLFCRMALSCLADGDHGDAASLTPTPVPEPVWPALCAQERLAALDHYVAQLGSGDERSSLRRALYHGCRTASTEHGFVFCDSPVGSGKTTALMAYLLHLAAEKGLRRIFVVLPFTNIISQSVEIYRKALTLPGEDPNLVVAELHHRAAFDDLSLRRLTALWRAPIVVTTAVAFFETLASNRPATLRRLHELPGSAVCLDEAHTALPLRLLPLAWRWMTQLEQHWGCHWVLASGSMVRFWDIPGLLDEASERCVHNLIPDGLQQRLADYEARRLSFRFARATKSRAELPAWVMSCPGPRLLIVNTIASAAVLADDFRRAYGRERVEHLSSALTPEDREAVLHRVRKRLQDERDTDWVLVATSCVEAGVDLSFRTGFRECASLLSLLQAAGRIDRNGLWGDGTIWSFVLQEDNMPAPNQDVAASADVLWKYFENEVEITPALGTDSIQKEWKSKAFARKKIQELIASEQEGQFASVEQKFTVIERDMVTAVVDAAFARQIQAGTADWQQLQRKSVSISRKKIQTYRGKPLGRDLYEWTLPYDDFLGYMAGVIEMERRR